MFFPDSHPVRMEILINNAQTQHPVEIQALQKRLETIMNALGQGNSELSVLLTDDPGIQDLNREYRAKDQTTDVLSFPQDEEAENGQGQTLLGDVVVSMETAALQAKDHNLSLEEELILLLIHGILHLMGHDHERSAQEAQIMKDKTRETFERIFPGRQPSGTSNF